MRTRVITLIAAVLIPILTRAMEDHTSQLFHMIEFETDMGTTRHGARLAWDLDGWIGTDNHKLWLKSEGISLDGHTPDQAEYWVMYSHTIDTFWDMQWGVRYDDTPHSTSYLTMGFDGLAPYSFETEAHVFVSDEGNISARIREKKDFLITQNLITQPYLEINLSAQDIKKEQTGAGVTDGYIGLQTRYEFSRKFAPYLDIRYEQPLGETSTLAKKYGNDQHDAIASVGVRFMF